MKVYDLLIAGCWVIFLVVWTISGIKAKRTVRHDFQKPRFWIRLFIFIPCIMLVNRILQKVGLPAAYMTTANPFFRAAGVAICAGGISFSIWARVHLGKNWGMPMAEKEAPELITTGPYHWVRHPIYTGICFALLGAALTEGSAFLLGAVWVVGFFIYSAMKEERLMQDQFADLYVEYKKHTKIIVPFLF